MTYILLIVTLLALELIYFRIADKFNIIDKPNMRSSHTRITLRGGGIIYLLGIWLYATFYRIPHIPFLVGMTAISLISFVDDVHSVPNKYRLLVQFASMMLMFCDFGILTIENWWVIIIALILCVGIINAYNFMDGINGITGGYSLVVLTMLLYVNHTISFIDNELLLIAIMSDLVFCFFNFRTKAKCFAGDVGSVGIAFIILFCLGKLILTTSDITYLMFLSVYGIDAALTIIHRILLHENLGQAHRKHAYQLMANELHIPHVAVSAIYMLLQIIISVGLIVVANKWAFSGVVLVALALGYILFKKKYYHLHVEYLKSKEA
ncbi:MAG: glycosyltransferase family 4 protein [Salinivirgaceae bacterium]|nr:glycosyltransferase family 4 protein [Salinivirgaceae bacterium]